VATHRFTTPAAALPDPRVETDPGRLRSWLERLPWANPSQVGAELLAALTPLNRYPERLRHRAQLADLFRAPCARLLKLAPHGAPDRDNAPLRRLMAEMGYAYKHLVNDALEQPTWLKQRKRLLHAIYHAVKYLSLELFLSLESYTCGNAQGLREILALYRLAQERHIQADAVADPDAPESASDITHLVKRIVLLQSLDPCHLQPGEGRAAFDLFNHLATAASFEPAAAGTPPAGRLLIDLQGMDPVRPWNGEAMDGDRYRCLDLLPAIAELKHRLRALEQHDAPPPHGLDHLRGLEPEWVMRRILKAWIQRRERQAPRSECIGWTLCASGLAAVAHHLARAHGVSPDDTPPDEVIDLGTGAPPAAGEYVRLRGRKVNCSRGGLCLQFPTESRPLPTVGQPVLIEEEGNGRLHCGIVRHTLHRDGQRVEAGIQLIQGVIHPIRIRVFSEGNDAAGFRPGLWVERRDPCLESLLIGKGLYREGRTLEVAEGRPATLVETTTRVEASIAFDRCGYRVVEP